MPQRRSSLSGGLCMVSPKKRWSGLLGGKAQGREVDGLTVRVAAPLATFGDNHCAQNLYCLLQPVIDYQIVIATGILHFSPGIAQAQLHGLLGIGAPSPQPFFQFRPGGGGDKEEDGAGMAAITEMPGALKT